MDINDVNCLCFNRITPGKEQEFLEELKKLDAVNEARIVMDEFDLVARLECESHNELKK